ncbi:MAG: Co2+/Mg2+ efflux protein ApaG [Fimbriimonadaceae bacterium]|nr:Co2+/Mg2+ efflux protein ApaG [Chitinophagales bacterium]
MVTATTQGVKISVETFFQPDVSNAVEFVFAYRITIENKSESTIKLLRRHWYIFDGIGIWREVEGEGVVGEQPVITPGGLHQYVSGCHLKASVGKMFGTYEMERQTDEFLFEVKIPEFLMITPFMLN